MEVGKTNGGANGSQARCASDAAREHLHPAWKDFIGYCQELQFGEVEKLKIQNGVPMMAEVTTRKIKFGSG